RPPAGDDAVSADAPLLHAEVARAMHREQVELGERSGVEQPLDALACGELALRVLRAFGGPAPADGVVAALSQHVDGAVGGAATGARAVARVGYRRINLVGAEVSCVGGARRRHGFPRGAWHRGTGYLTRDPLLQRDRGPVHP